MLDFDLWYIEYYRESGTKDFDSFIKMKTNGLFGS